LNKKVVFVSDIGFKTSVHYKYEHLGKMCLWWKINTTIFFVHYEEYNL